jgi:hypothetical protein
VTSSRGAAPDRVNHRPCELGHLNCLARPRRQVFKSYRPGRSSLRSLRSGPRSDVFSRTSGMSPADTGASCKVRPRAAAVPLSPLVQRGGYSWRASAAQVQHRLILKGTAALGEQSEWKTGE